MATLISTSAGSALSTGKPRKRLKITATITGLTAQITIIVPAGVSQLEFRAPLGLGGLLDVTPGGTEVYTFTRPEPALDENPHMTVSFAVPGYRSTPLKLRFQRDEGQVGAPVTLTTAGTMSAGTNSGTALTYTPYVWAGDVSAVEDTIWTSATEGGTYTDARERWTSIPYTTGTWFKRRARAFGPTVANPLVNDWTAWQETTPRQITARPAARTLVAGVDFRIAYTEYRPGSQSTWRTPIVEALAPIRDLNFELRATAADTSNLNPTWSSLEPRSGEANHFEMFDPGHPVSSPSADAALFNEASGTGRASRFSVSWRRDELEPWSARSTGINVPAVVTTGDPTADFTVSNLTDLIAAMNSATSGQEIACNPGNYEGTFSFQSKNKGNPGITVRPFLGKAAPVFLNNTINLTGSTGITFDGVDVTCTVRDPINGGIYPLYGGPRAFTVDNSTRITIRNCRISGQMLAINASNADDFTLEYNRIFGVGMDSVRIRSNCNRPIIRNNLFDEPNVDLSRVTEKDANGNETRHVDFIQFDNSTTGLGTQDGLIENNAFYGTYGYHQAIFMFNERTTRGVGTGTPSVASNGHNNNIIRGNYIEIRHRHAICISGASGILVENNLIRSKPPSTTPNGPSTDSPPQITVTGADNTNCHSSGIIRNNVQPTKGSYTDNGMDLMTGTVAALNAVQTNLTRTDNKRSATAEPIGWTMPAVGPYAYL